MIELAPLQPPQAGLRMTGHDTLAYIDNVNKGPGTLYIAEHEISWISNTEEGFTIQYPDISIFAVCRDQEKYPENCVYMLVQDDDKMENGSNSSGDEDYPTEVEVRFAPSGGTSIQEIFDCIQACNRLHPTPNEIDSDSAEGDEDGEDEDFADCMNGRSIEDSHENPEGQFEDAV